MNRPLPHELMAIQADDLFISNQNGRLIRLNERRHQPAPRLFLGHTQSGTLLRISEEVPDPHAREILSCVSHPVTDELLAKLRAIMERTRPVDRQWTGPAYAYRQLAVIEAKKEKHLR